MSGMNNQVKEESYNLICKGELLQGFELTDVTQQIIKLFKVSEAVALHLLNKKVHVIKKNVTWKQAVQYQNTLKSIGLIIYINLIYDADIFRESLIDVDNQSAQLNSNLINNTVKKPIVPTPSAATFRLLSFDIKKLIPSIFSGPHQEALFDDEDNTRFDLTSYRHIFNPVFLLLLSMFVALVVQKYFTLIFVELVSGQIATTLSILVFFSIILFLPRIMTSNRVISLRNFEDDSAFLLYVQVSSINPFVDKYHIFSQDEGVLAIVTKNKIKNKIKCMNIDGEMMFSSSEEHHVDDATKYAAREIRDNLFDFSMFSYLRIYRNVIRKLKKWLNKEQREYERSDAFVVRDSERVQIAYFIRDDISFVEYPSNSNESKTLIAFLLLCVGVS